MTITDYIVDLYKNPSRYGKFWVALVTAGLNLVTIYFPEADWLPVLINLLGALGVFAIPNKK